MVFNTSRRPRRFAVEWHSYYLTETLAPSAALTLRWRQKG